MKKYVVECGSLVTVLEQRTYVIIAENEEEAVKKAESCFDVDMDEMGAEISGTVIIDRISESEW